MPAAVLSNPPQTMPDRPPFIAPAPTNPPISACELDEGIPANHVTRFQMIAPVKAAKMTAGSTIFGSIMPEPTVFATLSPKNRKAMKLKNAAHITARRGDRTRVDTMVAIELAASCNPFRRSNSNATAISAKSRCSGMVVSARILAASKVLDQNAVNVVGDILEPVHDLLQMAINLRSYDERHRVICPIF